MKQLSLFLLIIVLYFISAFSSFSQIWVPLNGNSTPAKPICQVIETSDYYIILDVELLGFYKENVVENGTTYQKLSFPGYQTTHDIGLPALPNISELIRVPDGSNLNITVFNETVTYFSGYTIYPYQTPLLEDEVPIGFDIDETFYSTNAYYPGNSVTLSAIMSFRNVANTNMVLTPIKHNPVEEKLEILTSFQVRIYFDQMLDISAINFSETFDKLHKKTILNYVTPTTISPSKSTDYNLLIISADQYENELGTFINLKIGKGYKTKLVTVSEIGNTATLIKNYIANEYSNNNIEYVLLVGDYSDIPHVLDNEWPYDCPWGTNNPYSDYGYGCIDNDYQAEVLIGRFSIQNVNELNNIINKSISYELNPPLDNWMQKCLLIAHKENAPGKYQGCKETIRTASYSIMSPIFDIAYGSHSSEGGNDATNQTIIDAINDGRGVVNYRGHGYPQDEWKSDWSYEGVGFGQNQISMLTNNNKTPIVFSISCSNGWISGMYGLGESFTCYNNGAVAFYSATRFSYTSQNHTLDQSIFDYAFNIGNFNTISEITTAAITEMLVDWSYVCDAKWNARIYLWLGDPTLEIWTGIPNNFVVSTSPSELFIAPNNVDVTIDNLITGDEALVCLYKENEILEYQTVVGDINNQAIAVFSNITPITIGDVNVTVSSHNYIPFEGIIPVIICVAGIDLYMRDQPTDYGIEPNPSTDKYHISKDMWIRNQDDDGTVHQNPEYTTSLPIWVYVRVRNRGCQASLGTEELKTYWSTSGTALLDWDNSWINYYYDFGSGSVLTGDTIGTVAIPVLYPGESTIVKFPWFAPNPADFPHGGMDVQVCLVSRIETSTTPPYGMTFTETNIIGINTKNNNNIIWKNVTVVNDISWDKMGLVVGNSTGILRNFNFLFKVPDEELSKPFTADGMVTIDLGKEIYDKWVSGGKKGSGFEVGKFSHMSQTGIEHHHSPHHYPNAPSPYSIVITGTDAVLENIQFEPEELINISITFNFNAQPDGVTKKEFKYDIMQAATEDGTVLGGVRFDINRPECELPDAGGDVTIGRQCTTTLSASPIITDATYTWFDNSDGKFIGTGKSIEVSPTKTTTYELQMASPNGCLDYDVVTVNVDLGDNTIACGPIVTPPGCFKEVQIFPNPVNGDKLHVKFKAEEKANIDIKLVDMQGRVKERENVRVENPGTIERILPLDKVPPGVYKVIIRCKEKVHQELVTKM